MDAQLTTLGSTLTSFGESGIPSQVTFGFTSGFCTGYTAMKVGKAVSGLLGLCFVGLQSLSYLGYIKVDYGRLESEVRMKVEKEGGSGEMIRR